MSSDKSIALLASPTKLLPFDMMTEDPKTTTTEMAEKTNPTDSAVTMTSEYQKNEEADSKPSAIKTSSENKKPPTNKTASTSELSATIETMPLIIMGTWQETYDRSGVFNALVGGRPKPDWSGLDETQPFRAMQVSHYRPIDPIKRVKGAYYRTIGLKVKFSKGHSINNFQKDVWQHLVTHGLDTIAYLKDPFRSSSMINVVENHPKFCFNQANAVTLSKEGSKKFDQWDKENDADARQFLINSLDDDILEAIKHQIQPEFSFSTVWLYLIHHIITTSSARFDDIKATIRNMSPRQYEAQNITQLANDYLDKFKELESGGQMDYNLITPVLQSLRSADGPEIYKFSLLNLENQADTVINTVGFMSSDQKDKYMKEMKLDINSICEVATAAYRKARDSNQWGPLIQVRDRRGVPRASLVTLPDGSMAYAALAPVPYTPKGSKKELICWNCGEKRHTKQECTKPDTNNKFKPKESYGSKSSGHTKTNKEQNWNLVAPKKGDPETKTVEGSVWKYCAKCGYWNSSHTTAEHVEKDKGSGNHSNHQDNDDDKKPSALYAVPPTPYAMLYNISVCAPAKEGSDTDHDHLKPHTVDTYNAFDVVVWDSGASLSVTNNRKDFVSFQQLGISVATVGQSVFKASGIGMVKYMIINTNGEPHTITSKALYIPNATQKLLSVTDVLSKLPGGKFHMSDRCTVLEAPQVGKLEIKNNPVTNLPTSQVFCPAAGAKGALLNLRSKIMTTSYANRNLSKAHWHCRFGHATFRQALQLIRSGILATSEALQKLCRAGCKTTFYNHPDLQFVPQDSDNIQLEGAMTDLTPFAFDLRIHDKDFHNDVVRVRVSTLPAPVSGPPVDPACSTGREDTGNTSTSSPISTPNDTPSISTKDLTGQSTLAPSTTRTSNGTIKKMCLFLAMRTALALLVDWATCSIDFGPVYMHTPPRGSTPEDELQGEKYCSLTRRLKQSQYYGSTLAPCLWNTMTMIVVYKDDATIACKKSIDVDKFVHQLEGAGISSLRTKEGSFTECNLKIQYDKDLDEGNIAIKQEQDLIDKIITVANMRKDYNTTVTTSSLILLATTHYDTSQHTHHHYKTPTNAVVIFKKVATDLQKADHLTKGLKKKNTFANWCRHLNEEGW